MSSRDCTLSTNWLPFTPAILENALLYAYSSAKVCELWLLLSSSKASILSALSSASVPGFPKVSSASIKLRNLGVILVTARSNSCKPKPLPSNPALNLATEGMYCLMKPLIASAIKLPVATAPAPIALPAAPATPPNLPLPFTFIVLGFFANLSRLSTSFFNLCIFCCASLVFAVILTSAAIMLLFSFSSEC